MLYFNDLFLMEWWLNQSYFGYWFSFLFFSSVHLTKIECRLQNSFGCVFMGFMSKLLAFSPLQYFERVVNIMSRALELLESEQQKY